MEVFGELKNAYLEKDNAGKTALGAVCCGGNVISDVDSALTETPNMMVGNGTSATRVATSPEIISMNGRLSNTIGRVAAIEQRSAGGEGSSSTSLFNAYSGITFSNCYEQDAHGYRILRLQSSSAASSSIIYTGKLGNLLGGGSMPWSQSYPKRVECVGMANFMCQPLVWSTDLTQSLCYAAPYTDVGVLMDVIDIDNELFFEKPNYWQPRFQIDWLTENYSCGGKINFTVKLGGTSVIFHRANSGDVDPSVVEFVFQGLSYKMTYSTYVSSVMDIPVVLRAVFTHHYYGDRDTYAFIYPNYRYFSVGRKSTVLEL